MNNILNAIGGDVIFALICVFIVLIIIIFVYLFLKISKLEKSLSHFTGENSIFSRKFQNNINDFIDRITALELKYGDLIKLQKEVMQRQDACLQKIGIIRYNPFGDMGGNLSFSVAILDNGDNGIVITGIHSRTGSFTYAKPIVMGVSRYVLSDEEIKAIELAKENARKPLSEEDLKILYERPVFERKIKLYKVKQKVRRITEDDLYYNDVKIAEFYGRDKDIIIDKDDDIEDIEENEDDKNNDEIENENINQNEETTKEN